MPAASYHEKIGYSFMVATCTCLHTLTTGLLHMQ
jgi:hypothetical protein